METWVHEFEGHRSKVSDEDLVKGEQGESQEGEEKGKEEMEKTVEEEGKKPEEECLEIENMCMVAECALDEVEDALRVSIKHLQCFKEIFKKGKEGKKVFQRNVCILRNVSGDER